MPNTTDNSDLMKLWRELFRMEDRIASLAGQEDYNRKAVSAAFAELANIVQDAIQKRVEGGERLAQPFVPGDRLPNPIDPSDLWEFVSLLETLVDRRGTSNPHLRQLLNHAQHRDTERDVPDRANLDYAVKIFSELPAAEQQRILGGWAPVFARPKLEALHKRAAECGGAVVRGLVVHVSDKRIHAAVQDWRADDFAGAPLLEAWFTEGTSRDEALSLIDKMRAHVVTEFEGLIASPKEAVSLAAEGGAT